MMDRQTDSEVHDKGGKGATDLALKKADYSAKKVIIESVPYTPS